MNLRRSTLLVAAVATMVFLTSVPSAYARHPSGKLRIDVSPPQAYVFVDGLALKEGDCTGAHLCTIWLAPGEHTVEVHNYGYKTETRKVNLEAGKLTFLNVALQPEGGPVSPPWGRIEIKGAPPHAAVLLNGTTPDYFVGHVDEFDHEFLTGKEQLIVPPGTQHMTITWWGNTIWSGDVTVHPDETVVVNAKKNGATETHAWPQGGKISSLPRFKAGRASATVAVAPVKGEISASPGTIKCGESSTLNWSASEAVGAEISEIGKVAPTGSQTVSPKQTTTYDLSASGPGGVAKSSATVNVDSSIEASLSAEPTEVRYHKRGDEIIEQGSTTLTWSTSGAQSVSIDPLGTVAPNGSQSVKPTPTQTTNGPVNEDVTYTLHATNDCGGSATKTATVHITGLIEPAANVSEVEAVLTSVFFPTDYPDTRHPDDGLLASQKAALDKLADAFTKYHAVVPDSMLSLEAHADVRASLQYNQLLSERRAAIVKNYLVSKGVSADAIETHAFGKTQELNLAAVKQLEAQNPQKLAHMRRWYVDALAHNRRVDIVLMPEGKRSTPYYPHNAPDSGIMWQFHKPALKTVRAQE